MKSKITLSAIGILAILAGSSASAQDDNQNKFAGLDFGVGVSATFDLGSNDRISTAEVVNGIVRVTDKDNVRARIMLESHYFFEPNGKFLNTSSDDWGYGPFIALQPGTDQIIEAIGAGVMLGFRRKSSTESDSNQSFNIGFGVAFDPNTKTLGDDIINGQPLPEGETDVRFLEQDQVGLLILTSFSF